MKFNKHKNLEGLHAPFTASKPYWLRYTDERALEVYDNIQAKARGTKLHEWAKMTIDLGLKQPRNNQTLNKYINDAIGFHMDTEVVLFYSKYFFGTADAICYRNGVLRIHDLKTGKHEASMEQLLVYVALFCLEYSDFVKFAELKDCELRIYQNDKIIEHHPTVEEIAPIMDKIIHIDKLLAANEED